jgi:hypothetical protein
MSNMLTQEGSSDLNYRTATYSHSNVRYTKVMPTNGQAANALQSGSSIGPVEFLTSPNACMNFAKSKISFDIAMVTSATANQSAVASVNPLSYFSRIVVQLQSGQILMDCSNCGKLGTATTFLAQSKVVADSNSKGTPYLSATVALGQQAPFDMVNRADGGVNYYGDTVAADCGNLAPRMFVTSSAVTAGVSRSQYLSFQVSLGDLLPGLIFGLDKLLYFGSNTISIQFYLAPYDQWGWTAISGATSANPPVNITGSTSTGSLASASLSNFQLILAQESSYRLCQEVIDLATSESGIEMPIGYIFNQRTNVTGQQQSVQYQLTSGYGQSLRYIVWAPFQLSSAGNTADKWMGAFNNGIGVMSRSGDAGATANQMLVSYLDTVDQLAVSNSGFQWNTATAAEHWLANSRSFEGSCVQSVTDYTNNFAHICNYTGQVFGQGSDQTTDAGLSLRVPHVFAITANYAASCAVNHYVWVYTQKTLRINAGGVQLI